MSRLRREALFILTAWIFIQAPLCSAQTRTSIPAGFRHERSIVPGAPGPNRLPIDAALLAGANSDWRFSQQRAGSGQEAMILAMGGLKDLRIYDAAGHEVPYLLITPPSPESKWLAGKLSPLAATKKTSGFQIDLGQRRLLDRLQIEGLPAPFVKRCALEASNDGNQWMRLRDEATFFDLPSEKLRSLEIEFAQTEVRYLRAIWDDSASARLPLPRAVSVRLVSAGSLPPRMEVPLPFARRGSEPGVSRYRLQLPGPRLPVTAIRLSVEGGNVLRQARVSEGRLSGDEMIPYQLGSATLRRAVRGEVAAAEMSIPVAAPQEAQIDLVIEDGDNAPLAITQVSAVFAYLPWIYFESADTQALTARYGNSRLKEPRYDLEAMRAAAEKARTADAHWETEREILPEPARAADGAIPGVGSAIDIRGFRYARSVSAGKPGLTVLPLDAAVLAHSRIADLRIVRPDGRQISYLVERMDEPLSLDLPAPERIAAPRRAPSYTDKSTGSRSWYRVRLPFVKLPPARLVLTTSSRVFRRDLRLLIERNPHNERQKAWTESIAEATWTHADPETAAPSLTLKIPSIDATEAILMVEEGDNTPLPIQSAKLLLPSRRLRFFRSGNEELKLFYGHNDFSAPRYDLAILAPRLVGAAAEEARLGPEAEDSPAKAESISSKVFWGILIAAVIILLALIARLIKKT
jgi:hypothetical protein